MSLTEEYFRHQINYDHIYGSKTIILYQVGSFYEVYEYDPKEDQAENKNFPKKLGQATNASKVLNMKLTSKDKKEKHSVTNPRMVGFPCIAFDTHRPLLLQHNYTIVKFDQVVEDKKILRKIKEIISPGTETENMTSLPITNNICALYIEVQNAPKVVKYELYLIITGLSSIDVSCGTSRIVEFYSQVHDQSYALQETYRFLLSQSPREVIIYLHRVPKEEIDNYQKFITDELELHKFPSVHFKPSFKEDFLRPEYQELFLQKIFIQQSPKIEVPNIQLKSIIEDLELERYTYGRISYLLLLQYCYEHNETILDKIAKPEIVLEDKYLILERNAVLQLDLIPQPKILLNLNNRDKYNSLYDIITKTTTVLGKRYLKYRLLNPLTDEKELLQSYYNIQEIVENDLITPLESHLTNIVDLERFQKKLFMKTIKPGELCQLVSSYFSSIEIYKILLRHKNLSLLLFKEVHQLIETLKEVSLMINFDVLERSQVTQGVIEFESSFVQKGYNKKTDKIQETINSSKTNLDLICHHLNSFFPERKGKLIDFHIRKKKKNEDHEPYMIEMTQSKAERLKQEKIDVHLCGQLEYKKIGSRVFVSSDLIRSHFERYYDQNVQLQENLRNLYYSILEYFGRYTFYIPLVNFISQVDFYKGGAKLSQKYKYFKPEVIPYKEKTFLELKELRHPIIERISQHEYIPNDLTFEEGKNIGMILYSLNGVGKCLDPETLVITFRGEQIPVNKVVVGDLLMGDDGHPQRVLSITSGQDTMYEIIPQYGEPFIATHDHILVLKDDHGKIYDMTIDDYISSNRQLNLYSNVILFGSRLVIIDPYVLGSWLAYDKRSTIPEDDPFYVSLKIYNLLGEKHIPDAFKYNDVPTRRKVIEGLKSQGFQITQDRLSKDVKFVLQSLGFRLPPHFNSLSNYYSFPSKSSFEVKLVGVRDYCGFQLNREPKHFLLGDGTVTHNSSLLKAVALNVIMAQAGLYTPSKMRYTPFTRIITRLSGHDDLFNGDSSFSIEMKELRNILRHSTNRSLVLIDELCRGTESISGTSLTVSTIMELYQRKTIFILSSHLHHLVHLDEIKELVDKGGIKIHHLRATYNEVNQEIVYERKLQDGSGSSVYGIEVARALGIDPQFITRANKIRQTIMGRTEIYKTKKSKYNTKIYVDHCQLCQREINLETHHIRPQAEAIDGFIEHIPKNADYNLIVLCHQCHENLHLQGKELKKLQTPNRNIITTD